MLAVPKNSTQNAGSNENEAKELLCGMEAPVADLGVLKVTALEHPPRGYASTACAARMAAVS